jgi:hypothetical protein
VANGLNVDITADTKVFQSQVDDVSDALAKTVTELDKATQAGDNAGSSIEAGMRTAQESTAQAGSVFRQNTEVFKQGYQERVETTELSEGEINKIQKESLKTGAAAITAQVAQAAQGFDGTVESALESITNIGSGLAAFGGPEVAAAAAGVTLLTSFISGQLQKAQQDTEAQKEAVSELTATLEKLGKDGSSSVSNVDANLKKFSTTTDGSNNDLAHLKDTADQAGVSFTTYSRALAGNTDAQRELYSEVQKRIPILEESIQKASIGTQGRNRDVAAMQKELGALKSVSSALSDQNKNLGLSKDRLKDYDTALESSKSASQTAAATFAKAADGMSDIGSNLAAQQEQNNQALIDDQNKLATAVADSNGKQTAAVKKARADEVAASQKANVDTIAGFEAAQQTELQALLDKKANEVKIYELFGKEAGAAVIKDAGDNPNLLEALTKSSPADVAKIVDAYGQYGKASGENAWKTAQKALQVPLTPAPIDIPPLNVKGLLTNAQKQLDKNPLTVTVSSKFGRALP